MYIVVELKDFVNAIVHLFSFFHKLATRRFSGLPCSLVYAKVVAEEEPLHIIIIRSSAPVTPRRGEMPRSPVVTTGP